MKKYLEYITESSILKDQWFTAIADGDVDMIEYLIKRGINVNVKNEDNGITGLILAVEMKLENIIKILLSQPNIDVNIPDNDNWTPLMYASNSSRCKNIVKLLLAHPKIDVNIKSKNGVSALMFATQYTDNESTKLLLTHPDIDIKIEQRIDKNHLKVITDYNFLIDYDMQKTILNNNRIDILLWLDKYNLIHPDFKKENPELFKAKDWGLIS